MRWLVVCASLGLGACTALLGDDFEIVADTSQGGTGAADGGSAGAPMGGAGGGGGDGGTGGTTELPELECSIDETSIRDVRSATLPPVDYEPTFYLESIGGGDMRAILFTQMPPQIELYNVAQTGTSGVVPVNIGAQRLFHAARIDASQIGIQYLQAVGSTSAVVLRRYHDQDEQATNGEDHLLTSSTAFSDFNAMGGSPQATFFPIGNGGGATLGDILFALMFQRTSDLRYHIYFGHYTGSPVTPFDFANGLVANDLKPAMIITDAGSPFVFTGDFPVGAQYRINESAPGPVTPRVLPAGQTVGPLQRKADGTLRASGAIANLPTIERRIGIIPDQTLADIDLAELHAAGTQMGNDIVGGSGVGQRWIGDHLVTFGNPVGDDTELRLIVIHANGEVRVDEPFDFSSGLGPVASGLRIKSARVVSDEPIAFGSLDSTLDALVMFSDGAADSLFYMSIACVIPR